jgi:hypothetical protein
MRHGKRRRALQGFRILAIESFLAVAALPDAMGTWLWGAAKLGCGYSMREPFARICIAANHPPKGTPTLAYATPPARRGRPELGVLVALLGGGAGLFGALMLFFGITGIPYVFGRNNSIDFPGDVFGLVMFLLIGSICVCVAIRWCRAAWCIVCGR